MNELLITQLNNMLSNDNIDSIIENTLDYPQAACPVRHIFGGGVYIREVSISAGVFSIGHIQTTKHMNHMIKGRVIMLNEDGTTSEVVAPQIFEGKPGRKVGLILEDMVWHNIYPTNETDIETLESMFLDKTGVWELDNKCKVDIEYLMNHSVRDDFNTMLSDLNVTAETVRQQSENEIDLIDFPSGCYKVKVSDSYIQGKGLFITSPVLPGEIIAPARIDGKRTPAGRFTNHSPTPNAKMVLLTNGDMDLVAIQDIDGCYGGDHGEEVTVDYRQVIKEKGGVKCQE